LVKNQLASLPEGITNLTTLKVLNIENNPLSEELTTKLRGKMRGTKVIY